MARPAKEAHHTRIRDTWLIISLLCDEFAIRIHQQSTNITPLAFVEAYWFLSIINYFTI